MLKKILVGAFLLLMAGAVIAGAVNLFAQREDADECTGSNDGTRGALARQGAGNQAGQGAGQGRGREVQESDAPQNNYGKGQELGRGQGLGAGQGLGRAQGLGTGQGLGRGQGSNAVWQIEHSEWETVEGVVIETTELVIETHSDETVQVGLGPSAYREAQGFVLTVGDPVRISGYWEDDEFKAAHVENLDTGEAITLRDDSGRPMWAGQGRGQNRG